MSTTRYIYIYITREWMSSTNGGIMDNLEGENYKIIIGDAFKFLKTAKYVIFLGLP